MSAGSPTRAQVSAGSSVCRVSNQTHEPSKVSAGSPHAGPVSTPTLQRVQSVCRVRRVDDWRVSGGGPAPAAYPSPSRLRRLFAVPGSRLCTTDTGAAAGSRDQLQGCDEGRHRQVRPLAQVPPQPLVHVPCQAPPPPPAVAGYRCSRTACGPVAPHETASRRGPPARIRRGLGPLSVTRSRLGPRVRSTSSQLGGGGPLQRE